MEEILIKKAIEKDKQAFERLVKLYKNKLYSYLFRFSNDANVAGELFQETIIGMWKGIKTYNHNSKFSSWVFTIAHNAAIDYSRKENKRKRVVSIDYEHHQIGYQPDFALENKELTDYILKCLDTIPEDQKHVFLLRTTAGLPFREIAEIRNEPLNSVISKMHYAVKKIRKIVMEQNVA